MKPNYSNWVPMKLIVLLSLITVAVLLLQIKFNNVIFLVATIIFSISTVWMAVLRYIFSYNGKIRLAAKIIEYISEYVDTDIGNKILDVGCGSGAFAISGAKKNPGSLVTGVDIWGAEYSNFSKVLCYKNAVLENVKNIEFVKGDACSLDFQDETFDVVISNYVYHNISGVNKKDLLRETLRVLRKGGTFVIHDIMSEARYGNMEEFICELKNKGYSNVKLIDTDDGTLINKIVAVICGLKGSKLLVGKK